MTLLEHHFKILHEFLEAIPEPGKEIDYQELKRKKDLAQKMIHNFEHMSEKIEPFFLQEPLAEKNCTCPKVDP